MDTLKEWWDDPLAEEIYHNMQARECDLPVYYSKSPQLHCRRTLVDWLSVINDNFNMCITARQLSVTLMDYFMDNYDIEDHLLKLVAIGSLLVAAKFEEKDENIPKAKSLNAYLPSPGYQLWEYLRMELTLLEFFQWKICLPTPAHFIDFLLMHSVLPSDLHDDRPIHDCDRVRKYVDKYNNYFLEITLQDEWYRNFKPSLISAACVASSRICLRICPHWSPQLAVASGYGWDQLHPLVIRMMKTYSIDEEAQRDKSVGQDSDSAGVSPCSSTTGSPGSTCSSDIPGTTTTSLSASGGGGGGSLADVFFSVRPASVASPDSAIGMGGDVMYTYNVT